MSIKSNRVITFLSSMSVSFILSWVFIYMFLMFLKLIILSPIILFLVCGGLAMYVDYKIQHKYIPKVLSTWDNIKSKFTFRKSTTV